MSGNGSDNKYNSDGSDNKSSFRPLLNEEKPRLLIHSFLDVRQLCIINRVSKWWYGWLSGSFQDTRIWREVNLSVSAPHAVTDGVLTTLFKSHPTIQHLDLKFCGKISDKAIEEASNLKDLQRLEIEGCGRRLSDKGVKYLSKCSNLTTLNLNGCQQITPPVIEMLLKDCKSIHTLAIGSMTTLEDKSLTSILSAGSQIRRLYLNNDSKLTNLAVIDGAKLLNAKLEELEIAYCANIDDDAIVQLAQYAPNLTSLNLYGCFKITDKALQALSTHTTGEKSLLKKLNLSQCRNITDAGLRHLLEGKKNCSGTLESLHLYDCARISNQGIILIGGKCPRLKVLEVFGLDALDMTGLETFLSLATSLEKLDCGGCQKITPISLETLMKRYSHLFA